jgi:Kef-type K+ transport system membrane component KefB/mannitol/fructose-specific phosphotransferase system IIA component (Ntr-type)
VFKGITSLAVVLFLLVVGMEVNLAAIRRQSRAGLAVSAGGMLIPFGLGFLVAWHWPALLGMSGGADPLIFALFIATAMAISALPVIAKTLMDINLFTSDLGMVVISAAIFNDLVGWIIFAIIIGMMGASAPGGAEHHAPAEVVLLALTFAAAMLTIGRWLLHRVLPWIQAHLSWPGGVLSFTLALSLFGAALSEWVGLHAIFGSFLVGVAIGDSHHLRERTRAVIVQFISFFFAPLFFASIGLGVDFLANFDPLMVAVMLVLACAGKVLGCALGARLSGMGARESWAVGWGMNSRGAMEILLGTIALRVELINARTFVALVVVALATSMMAGPLMQHVLKRKRTRRLVDHLAARGFILELSGSTPEEVIRELAAVVAPQAGLGVEEVAAAVIARERSMSTAFGKHLAVPHARLDGLQAPLVGIGLKAGGVAFAAPDGEPVRLVVMLLTSTEDNGDQIALLADVAATFKGDEAGAQLLAVRSFTEFLALVQALQGGAADHARAERARRAALSANAGGRAGSDRGSG